MPRPKKGDICRIFASHAHDSSYEGGAFYVVCTGAKGMFFNSVSGPFEKITQYPISAIELILEDEEAMRVFRQLMHAKTKEK